jgi:hypothetical protein
MKRGSTLFLRGVIVIIGLIVLALCVFLLPQGIADPNAGGYRFILLGMYLPAIPFFIALYQGLKLLNHIDQNQAFSERSVSALGTIKNCAIAIGALYAAGLPLIFIVAERDDAPGVVLIGLVFTFAPMVVAVIAATLQKLLHGAIAIKSENDLTV